MVLKHPSARNRALALVVRKTIKRLLNPRGRRKKLAEELKGNATSLRVKEYFLCPLCSFRFFLVNLEEADIIIDINS